MTASSLEKKTKKTKKNNKNKQTNKQKAKWISNFKSTNR